MADLADIRIKVRRLTRSPSDSQLTDVTIDDYVNNFLLYDFPEELRLFTFKKMLTFYTQPNIARYDTNTLRNADPLYDFKNAYITTSDPVYVSGYQAYFTQSVNDFYRRYPQIQGQYRVGTGDAATMLFTGTLTGHPVLANNVMFTSIDANGEGIILTDIPRTDPVTGVPTIIGDLVWPDEAASRGTINYVTGVYSFTFAAAPDTDQPVWAHTYIYQAARPCSMLYYGNVFTLRPVPDKTYAVNIETYIRPTALIGAAALPELEQHWQYIALSAARSILIDRLDIETLQLILPELKHQELLCQRRTIVQQSNEQVATIYNQPGGPNGYGRGWFNSF